MKRRKALGGKRQISFEQPFELEEWLIVERNIVDLTERNGPLLQAIGKRLMGEAGIVFLAREALLLSGGDNSSVDYECRRTVVVECRQSKNSHTADFASLEDCVDEGSDCRALGEHDQ